MLYSRLRKCFIAQRRKRKKAFNYNKQHSKVGKQLSRVSRTLYNKTCYLCGTELYGKRERAAMTTKQMSTKFVKDCGYIPAVLTNGASIVEKNLKTKDLFQIQGSSTKINYILTQLGVSKATRVKNVSVHDVIEAMKTYLVRLPEPLLPESVCNALIKASPEEYSKSYRNILSEFRQSQPHSFAILHFMMLLLQKVASYAAYNAMDVRKLATIFVLDVVNPLKIDDPTHGSYLVERMQRLPYIIMVIEYMINNVHIFNTICQLKGPVSPIAGASSLKVLSTPLRKSRSNICTPRVPTSSFLSQIQHHSSVEKMNQGDGLVTPQLKHSVGERQSAHKKMDKFRWSPDIATKCNSQPRKCDIHLEEDLSPCGMELEAAKRFIPSPDLQNNTSSWRTKRSPGKSIVKMHKRLTSPSPKARRSSHSRSEFNAELKPPRSLDRKHSSKGRVASNGPEGKKKRKSKSGQRQEHHTKAKGRSQSHDSDYMAFHANEEMSPWNDMGSLSDDTSVLAKTIQNPRFLAEQLEPTISAYKPGKCNIWRCKYKDAPKSPKKKAADIEKPKVSPKVTLKTSVSPSAIDKNISIAQSMWLFKGETLSETLEYEWTQEDKIEYHDFKPLMTQAKPASEMHRLDSKEVNPPRITQYNKYIFAQTVSQGLRNRSVHVDTTTTTVSHSLDPVETRSPTPNAVAADDGGTETMAEPKKPSRPVSGRRPGGLKCRPSRVRIPYTPNWRPREVRQKPFVEKLMDVILVIVTLLCTCLVFYSHYHSKPLKS